MRESENEIPRANNVLASSYLSFTETKRAERRMESSVGSYEDERMSKVEVRAIDTSTFASSLHRDRSWAISM